jgi:hypothetical protein
MIQPGLCPQQYGFCGWTFLGKTDELTVVENMLEDARCGSMM